VTHLISEDRGNEISKWQLELAIDTVDRELDSYHRLVDSSSSSCSGGRRHVDEDVLACLLLWLNDDRAGGG